MPKRSARKIGAEDEMSLQRQFELLLRRLKQHDDRPRDAGRRDRGVRSVAEIVGVQGGEVLNELVNFSPELTRFIVDFAYGDVLSRDNLDARSRALVVVASLASLGNARPQLETHVHSALRSGCTREEILEVLLIVSVYAGFPAALNGMAAARKAFDGKSNPRGRRKASRKGKRKRVEGPSEA